MRFFSDTPLGVILAVFLALANLVRCDVVKLKDSSNHYEFRFTSVHQAENIFEAVYTVTNSFHDGIYSLLIYEP